MRQSRLREWLQDLLVGGGAGLVVALVAAVNFVIYIGVEGGYEASLTDVFRHGLWAGLATVAILVAGPVVGTVLARRRRHPG